MYQKKNVGFIQYHGDTIEALKGSYTLIWGCSSCRNFKDAVSYKCLCKIYQKAPQYII